ncbi:NAD(P)/FAD-dependent oxidoreductase [Brevibacillus daliensis]|uniref:NAD(P)/FAD-dependent oxidoreductase n=1 Tax=Brevibacillus daliensis TaxID=2892995 RepID=UPI001E56F0D5|nr:FAD-dependent oxidoreductase [Brevibacillus daliensis]
MTLFSPASEILPILIVIKAGATMNLKTGSLLWMDSYPDAPTYPCLENDIACDVLVIGGGEAGALTAYQLIKCGLDVVLVDKRSIAHGTSSASTGLLQFANDKSLGSFVHSIGEENGCRFYQLCREALEHLSDITNSLPLSVDFQRRPCLYFASCPEDVITVQTEYELYKKMGFPVTYFTEGQIAERFPFKKLAGLYSEGDAEVNPYKLAHGLIQYGQQRGMRVFEKTEIKRHRMEEGKLLFLSSNGSHIRCKYAVYATGYETQEYKSNSNAFLGSTYALATQPYEDFSSWTDRCLIWETARPYLYIRTTADNRVIAGGLDIATAKEQDRDKRLLHKTELLIEKLQELFPTLPEMKAEYAWAGTIGGTHDGLPLFGPQEGYPNSYFILGYGGNGTVCSTVGSLILKDLITKGHHPDAEMFSFIRQHHS